MKETVCKKCNKAYDAAFDFCPYCGQRNAPGIDDPFAEYEQYISTKALARASVSHDNGEYMEGYNRLPGFVISEMLSRQLREARLGSVVYMGRIMQDGFGPTPIGWRVIATSEDELLLLSERIILSAPPMWSGKWTDSILFSDIDYSFFKEAFNCFEAECISVKPHNTGYYCKWDRDSKLDMCMDQSDGEHIFILSPDEVKRYLKGSMHKYVNARATKTVRAKGGKYVASWMLRRASDEYHNPYWRITRQYAICAPFGSIKTFAIKYFRNRHDVPVQIGPFDKQYKYSDIVFGVRPAMWVKKKVK